MNKNICPNCQTQNLSNQPFCVTCGQPLTGAQPGFQSNEPPVMPGFPPHRAPAAKKSRMGLWLALLAGGAVLVLLLGGVALAGLFFYLNSGKQETDYNSSSNDLSQSNSSITNKNIPFDTPPVATELTEDDKYRLVYAASKVNDKNLTMKVSKKIGIIDERNRPTPFFKTFTAGMVKWATRDTEFIRKVDTREKAIEYINSQMPGAAVSSNLSSSSASKPVSLGVINGKATNLVTPAYPAAAKAVKAAGAVNVQVMLDETGNVTSANAQSGHPLLRASAMQAARESKFNPTVLNGQAVKASGIIVYNFQAQ
jgi:TonB family protein